MAETLSIISVACYAAAVFFLILAVFFFFFFRIPSVMGDLSGRTARKSIAKNRLRNEKSGSKSYRPSDVNKNRGTITGSMSEKVGRADKTGKKAEKKSKKELVFATMDDRPETGLLNENSATSVDTNETAPLDTVVSGEDSGTTEMLDAVAVPEKSFIRGGGMKLTLLDEVIMVHTDEVIG